MKKLIFVIIVGLLGSGCASVVKGLGEGLKVQGQVASSHQNDTVYCTGTKDSFGMYTSTCH